MGRKLVKKPTVGHLWTVSPLPLLDVQTKSELIIPERVPPPDVTLMSSRGRGETVQRWPTVGFFTSLRPIGAHATRQSSREQGIVLQSSREVG